jgi:hypothetical protein
MMADSTSASSGLTTRSRSESVLERVSKLVVWVWSVGACHGLGGRGVS